MARHPASVVRSVLGPPVNTPERERFFLFELEIYLRTRKGDIRKFLKKQGLVRWWRAKKVGGRQKAWTTARGVALSIAYFRAKQGAKPFKETRPLKAQH